MNLALSFILTSATNFNHDFASLNGKCEMNEETIDNKVHDFDTQQPRNYNQPECAQQVDVTSHRGANKGTPNTRYFQSPPHVEQSPGLG